LRTCPLTQGYRKEPLCHTKRRSGRQAASLDAPPSTTPLLSPFGSRPYGTPCISRLRYPPCRLFVDRICNSHTHQPVSISVSFPGFPVPVSRDLNNCFIPAFPGNFSRVTKNRIYYVFIFIYLAFRVFSIKCYEFTYKKPQLLA
jgi:hypothetical protein